MLSTFNEIDMTSLMAMRSQYKDVFLETHGVKLGFMSAFAKAASSALEIVPAVNAVIDNTEIVYRDYVDISVAVSTPKGLVGPVLRNVDGMRFADVEKVRLRLFTMHARPHELATGKVEGASRFPPLHHALLNDASELYTSCSLVEIALRRLQHHHEGICQGHRLLFVLFNSDWGGLRATRSQRLRASDCTSEARSLLVRAIWAQRKDIDIFREWLQEIVALGKKAKDSTLSIDEMSGGTFTISNGGVYGSLLSTPIINPPQSAILGMHSIQQRPMVINGEIKPRPMMYVALTYDHRLIDGREVCSFDSTRHHLAATLPGLSTACTA